MVRGCLVSEGDRLKVLPCLATECSAHPGPVSWRSPGTGWCPGCFGWLELADLAGGDEADLLGDVDSLVAESLQEAGDQHQPGGPGDGGRVGDLLQLPKDVVVELVDRRVQGWEPLGGGAVGVSEAGQRGVHDLADAVPIWVRVA
jgi:hypothetical protein